MTRATTVCPNPKCRLVQFRTAKDKCPRCGVSTAPPKPKAQPGPQLAPLPRLDGGELNRAVALVLRRRRKGSQPELAQATGFPRSYISKCENGTANPKLSSLLRFADGFKMPLAELVTEIVAMRDALAKEKE